MVTRGDLEWADTDNHGGNNETARVRLMNRTLRTENDFLREELEAMRLNAGYSSDNNARKNAAANDHDSIKRLELRYEELEEEKQEAQA